MDAAIQTLIEQGVLGALVILLGVAVYILWRSSQRMTEAYIDTLKGAAEVQSQHDKRAEQRHKLVMEAIHDNHEARRQAEEATLDGLREVALALKKGNGHAGTTLRDEAR